MTVSALAIDAIDKALIDPGLGESVSAKIDALETKRAHCRRSVALPL